MSFEVLLGAWVAAGLTLFIFTFLYKDNPLFKLAEHLYVGISVGYTVVKGYELLFRLIIDPVFDAGEWWRLIPVAIGTLMLARYVPKLTWLSRIAFAFVVGVGSGLAIPRLISSFVLKQVEDTVRPLVSVLEGGVIRPTLDLLNPGSSLNSVVILVGVISVLWYFFFSIEHSGPGKVTARTGIIFLMLAFGAAFGYTAMARMSLLIGRFMDLIDFSGAQYGRASLWLLVATVTILIVWSLQQREEE
ncbi:MAG: hypothetical protein ACE5NA_08145 [Nitrospiraceae bacterium]